MQQARFNPIVTRSECEVLSSTREFIRTSGVDSDARRARLDASIAGVERPELRPIVDALYTAHNAIQSTDYSLLHAALQTAQSTVDKTKAVPRPIPPPGCLPK